jgi:hypothetical protein
MAWLHFSFPIAKVSQSITLGTFGTVTFSGKIGRTDFFDKYAVLVGITLISVKK